MPSLTIDVPLVAGKGRPRFYNGHAVTPKNTRDAEGVIRRVWAKASMALHGWEPAPKGAEVRVRIDLYAPLPKSRPRRVDSEPFVVKPDIDNACKLALDALNGVAWHDDAQVTELHAIKHRRRRGIARLTRITVEWGEE